MDSILSSVVSLYVSLKAKYDTIQENRESWAFMREEIFIYDELLQKKIDECRSSKAPLQFAGPIKLFYDGLTGIDQLFKDYGQQKGIIQKMCFFCSEFCNASDNRTRIREASHRIAHAGALMQISCTMNIEEQQKKGGENISRMMTKVEAVFKEQLQIKDRIQAIASRLSQSPEELARCIAQELRIDLIEVKKSIEGDPQLWSQISQKQDALLDGQNQIAGDMKKILQLLQAVKERDVFRIPKLDDGTEVVAIHDPAAKEFWDQSFQGLFAVASSDFIAALQKVKFSHKSLQQDRRLTRDEAKLVYKLVDHDQNDVVTRVELNEFCRSNDFTVAVLSAVDPKLIESVQLENESDIDQMLSICNEIFAREDQVLTVSASFQQRRPSEDTAGMQAKIQRLMKKCENRLECCLDQVLGKRNVVIMGMTGSGKSTMVNRLAGCRLREYTDDECIAKGLNPGCLIVDETSPREPVTKIGELHGKSETKILSPVVLDEFILWDAPGFEDTDGCEENIANAVNLHKLLETSQKGKGMVILLVVDYFTLNSLKGGNLSKLVHIILQIFGKKIDTLINNIDGISVCVTKVPEKCRLAVIKHWISEASKNIKLEGISKETIDLRFNADNIIIFDPISDSMSEAALRHKDAIDAGTLKDRILEMNSISAQFFISINEKDVMFLEALASDIQTEVKRQMQNADFDQVHQLAKLLKTLMVIEHYMLSTSESALQKHIIDCLKEWHDEIKVRELEFKSSSRREVRALLKKLKDSIALQDLLPMDLCNINERYIISAESSVKQAEFKQQTFENNEARIKHHELFEKLTVALQDRKKDMKNWFQLSSLQKPTNYTEILRSCHDLDAAKDILFFFNEIRNRSKVRKEKFIFGDQQGLEPLQMEWIGKLNDHLRGAVESFLRDEFSSCIAAINVAATSVFNNAEFSEFGWWLDNLIETEEKISFLLKPFQRIDGKLSISAHGLMLAAQYQSDVFQDEMIKRMNNIVFPLICDLSVRIFTERVGSQREKCMRDFEMKMRLSVDKFAVSIRKGLLNLQERLENSLTSHALLWKRLQSQMSRFDCVKKKVQEISGIEQHVIKSIEGLVDKWVLEFSQRVSKQADECVDELSKAGKQLLNTEPEVLWERVCAAHGMLTLREFGFSSDLVDKVSELLTELKTKDINQDYAVVSKKIDAILAEIHRSACKGFAQNVADERKKLMELFATNKIEEGSLETNMSTLQDELEKVMTSHGACAKWDKIRSLADRFCYEDLTRHVDEVDHVKKNVLQRVQSTASAAATALKLKRQTEEREKCGRNLDLYLDRKEFDKDGDAVLKTLDDLKVLCEQHDTLEFYNACVDRTRRRLHNLQEQEEINTFISLGNYNGLIARYRTLAQITRRLERHFILDITAIGNAALEQCNKLIKEAKQEITRDANDPDFLSMDKLRACFSIIGTVQSAFKFKDNLVQDLTSKILEIVKQRVEEACFEVKTKQDKEGLSRESETKIAKLLIKGYGMSSEVNLQKSFTTYVRMHLLEKLDALSQMEVGNALMIFVGKDSIKDTDVNAAEVARSILDTFPEFRRFAIELWNSKSGGTSFEDAIENLKPQLRQEQKNILITAKAAFDSTYCKLVEAIVADIINYPKKEGKQNLKSINEIAINLQNAMHGNKLNLDVHKASELLARISAEWTYLSAKDGSPGLEKKYVIQPHSVQILGIFKLLGLDQSGLQHHLIQINTGEGKSVAIGLTAALLCKLGFSVDVVCYSTYLSGRDHREFKDLFEYLGISDTVHYSDFTVLAGKVIEDAVVIPNIRKVFQNLLEKQQCKNMMRSTDSKTILFLDEVDVFFSDKFLGITYNPLHDIGDEESFKLLVELWNNRHKCSSEHKTSQWLKSSQYYKALAMRYPFMGYFVDKEIPTIFASLSKFPMDGFPKLTGAAANYKFETKTHRIGYVDDKSAGLTFNSFYGYDTHFTFFYKCDGQIPPITPASMKWKPKLGFICGKLLYSEIPKCYDICLGMTGTLGCLNKDQQNLLKEYKFELQTFLPSTFQKKNLAVSKTVIIHGSWDDYFSTILQELEAQLKLGRATLVVFESEKYMGIFAKEIQKRHPKHQRYTPPAELTDSVEDSKRDALIAKAIRKHSITLMTRSYGRGTDFVCRDKGLVANGGVHVIVTFFPQDESENKQIKGRTCRQDDPGSVAKILFSDWLKAQFPEFSMVDKDNYVADKQDDSATDPDDLDEDTQEDRYLKKLRAAFEKGRFEKLRKEEATQLEQHKKTIEACKLVEKANFQAAKDIFLTL